MVENFLGFSFIGGALCSCGRHHDCVLNALIGGLVRPAIPQLARYNSAKLTNTISVTDMPLRLDAMRFAVNLTQ